MKWGCGIWCFPGCEGLVKDAVELHHGKCRIPCFWSLTISASADSILIFHCFMPL